MELDVPQERSAVNCIAFSNLGKYMAAAWNGQSITRLYSLHKNCSFVDMNGSKASPQAAVNSLQFDFYGNFLVTGTDAGFNLFYQRNPGQPMGSVATTEPVHTVKFCNTGKDIYGRSGDKGVMHLKC
jgi:WD40 repeat protein